MEVVAAVAAAHFIGHQCRAIVFYCYLHYVVCNCVLLYLLFCLELMCVIQYW